MTAHAHAHNPAPAGKMVLLIRWCQAHGVLYLDTCIEPWAGGYAAADASTTNYALRRAALALHRLGAPTALVAHGANRRGLHAIGT